MTTAVPVPTIAYSVGNEVDTVENVTVCGPGSATEARDRMGGPTFVEAAFDGNCAGVDKTAIVHPGALLSSD
jgi:hypothetical protein